MDESTLRDAFSVSPATSGLVTTVSNGTVLVFRPSVKYIHGTRYTASLSTDARDATGNPLLEDCRISFLAGTDFTPPSLVTFSTQGGTPLATDGSTTHGISKRSSFVLTFSEAMQAAATVSAFQIEPSVAGTVTVAGTRLVFTPDAPLACATLYRIRLASSACDAAGNTMTEEKSLRFLTDAADSRYLAVTEIRGENGGLWTQNMTVAITNSRLTNLSIRFTAPVTYLSILPAFSISQFSGTTGSSPNIAKVSFADSGRLFRFNLAGLAEGNIYKLEISTDGRDTNDNPLNESWSFFFQT